MTKITSKSFWERPEGKFGTFVLAGLIIGGGYLLYHGLPYIIELAKNMYIAIGMIVGLVGIAYVLFDLRFRTLLWYLYQSFMRKLTGAIIMIDPVAIAESYVGDLEKKQGVMGRQMTVLSGEKRKLKTIIDNNKAEYSDNLGIMRQAEKKNKKGLMIIKSRAAGRLEKYTVKYEELLSKMEVIYKILDKMHEASGWMIEDLKDEVKHAKIEKSIIKKSHGIMKSAYNIIQGNDDKKVMFDQAMEFIVDDVSMKVGEMERFMDVSSSFIDGMDLENGMFEEKGMEMLQKWEEEGSLFLFDDKSANKALTSGNVNHLNSAKQPVKHMAPVVRNTATNNGTITNKYFN